MIDAATLLTTAIAHAPATFAAAVVSYVGHQTTLPVAARADVNESGNRALARLSAGPSWGTRAAGRREYGYRRGFLTDNELQVTSGTFGRVSRQPVPAGWHSGGVAQLRRTRSGAWRHPLSLGFEAHRGVLLLRLRWHERNHQRRALTSHPGAGDAPSI